MRVVTAFFAVLLVALGHAADKKPPHRALARTARWLMNEVDYGILTTISTIPVLEGAPFGNPQSVVDGPIGNGTGLPYFYVSELDVSQIDIAANKTCSFTVSEAQLGTGCEETDPEDPTCVRLTLTGEVVDVKEGLELAFAKQALFTRHPNMQGWPADHNWRIKKLVPRHIFILDYYGGPQPLSVDDYLGAIV